MIRMMANVGVAVLLMLTMNGCGPSRYERLLVKHAVRLDPLVDTGMKKDVARFYGPPHNKDLVEEIEFWSYRYAYDEVVWVPRGYYYGVSYGYGRHHYGHHRGMCGPYPYFYPPQTYFRTHSYELLFEFDPEGVLRNWQFFNQ